MGKDTKGGSGLLLHRKVRALRWGRLTNATRFVDTAAERRKRKYVYICLYAYL